jgi:nicotinate-nucleotide pyrophosphorylase (carboxylating)
MFFMDAHSRLQLSDKAYLKAVQLYVWGAYLLDSPKADVSTKAFLGAGRQIITANVRTNEDGILAGMQEAEWLLSKLGLKILKAKNDGTRLKKGEMFLEIEGRASMILGVERTLLNLLQRMSGVATKTKRFKLKMPKGVRLLATRKTLWGLLDKRAVSLGGGSTHRLDLSDAILIKDNHIALVSNFKRSLKRAFKRSAKVKFLEVELDSVERVEEFLKLFKKLGKLLNEETGMAVMLDNFNPRDIRKVIKPLVDAGLFVELSGGINERNLMRYNIVGVSAISSGALTARADNLDFSLEVTTK